MATTIPAGSRTLAEDLLAITSLIDSWNGPLTAWVPTHTNLTIGAGGIVSARYFRLGKMVWVDWRFTMGSGSAVGTSPNITLPVTADAQYGSLAGLLDPGAYLRDVGTTDYRGAARWASTSAVDLVYYPAGGTVAAVTATAPFTWSAVGTDQMRFQGWYVAA